MRTEKEIQSNDKDQYCGEADQWPEIRQGDNSTGVWLYTYVFLYRST